MTIRSLLITNDRYKLRRLVKINGRRAWLCDSCVNTILRLSRSDDYTPDRELNAAPGNISRYVYVWHKDLEKQGFAVKLFQNNKANGWKLTIPIDRIRYQAAFGDCVMPRVGV